MSLMPSRRHRKRTAAVLTSENGGRGGWHWTTGWRYVLLGWGQACPRNDPGGSQCLLYQRAWVSAKATSNPFWKCRPKFKNMSPGENFRAQNLKNIWEWIFKDTQEKKGLKPNYQLPSFSFHCPPVNVCHNRGIDNSLYSPRLRK